ncbi:MAG TPA: hypothetical protein VLD67_16870 [Vicinamibacterales bacterium]|nr:hypothetical protein [Vicinamibacterales bacterium]
MSADESITSLSEAVAELGALPLPVGPELQASVAEQVSAEIARFGIYGGAVAATKALVKRADELVTENGQLRARVAELEAERHTTNEALDDAVQELRRRETGPALPWAHAMSDDDLPGFLDDLVSAAMGRWRSEPEVPDRVVLADVEKACADWRTPGQGYRSDPEPEPVPDAVTRVFAPVASLREPDGEFHGALHHTYRVSHDMPETGGDGRG